MEMDEADISQCLDACLLTEEEMGAGEIFWSTFNDSFPEWMMPTAPIAAEVE